MNDFDAIVAAHSAAVWRTAYRLLNHRDDALDCHQETFLAALRMRHGEVRHWRGLLLRIATQKAIDRLRERYRARRTACELQQRSLSASEGIAPDGAADNEELLEHIRRGLAELPAQQAEAFWLRHLEALSAVEVAEQMGIEPGHVRVLAHRAALGLRERLGPTWGTASIAEESP